MKTSTLAIALGLLVTPIAFAADDFGPEGEEFQVNGYSTGNQIEPQAASGPAGELVVVWSDKSLQDGDGYGIQGRRYSSDGQDLGAEFTVNSTGTSNQRNPAVAVGQGGDFFVAWTDESGQDGDDRGIQARSFDSGGQAVGLEFGVNENATGQQVLPAVAAGAGSQFLVVWEDRSGIDGDGSSIGGALAPTMHRVQDLAINQFTAGDQRVPDVASGANGGFTVVWSGYGDGSLVSIQGRRLDSLGFPIGGEFTVNAYTTGFQDSPAIASTAGGAFMVAWHDGGYGYAGQDGDAFGIQARRFAADATPLADEVTVNTVGTGLQLTPDVAIGPGREALVAWSDGSGQDGNGPGVQAQRFGADGVALGGEFAVNSYTPYAQAYPSVAAGPRGSFAIAWSAQFGPDGDAASVQAQRYRQDSIFDDGFELEEGACAWSSVVPDDCG